MAHIVDFDRSDFQDDYYTSSWSHSTSSSQSAIDARWNLLSEFVKRTCADRDESHGHAHMKAVAEMSRHIINQDYHDRRQYDNLILDSITAAWLHDIADHKYDHDGKLEQRLDEFGYKNFMNYGDLKKVIKYVSFSSENKAIFTGTPLDYDSLLTPYYALVRHIVSDADKLQAIGKIGITRALMYTRDSNPTYTEAQVIVDVRRHADEKLLRIATEFMRTPTGRMLAQKEHEAMVNELQQLPRPAARVYMFGDD
jgi:HD superfamily phosphodiesterase